MQVHEITEKVAMSMPGVVADLEELVAIPSVSFPGDPSEPMVAMEAMAQRTLQMFCAARFADARLTDVQPALPEQGWTSEPSTCEDDGRAPLRSSAWSWPRHRSSDASRPPATATDRTPTAPAVGPLPKGHAMSEETTHTTEAVGDGGTTLFVADFNDTETAWEAYEALTSVEDGRHVKITGVIVVKRGADGEIDVQKATDHSTRRGLTWGLVGGATLGLLFPPTLIGSAVVLGGAGAALGKARQLHRKSELTDRLEYALAPGHSGIVAIVSDSAVPEIRATLASANAIVESALDDIVAKDIKALAKEAEKE